MAGYILGLGSSRMVARKYLAQEVKQWALLKYTTIFIAVSTLGLLIGPVITVILLINYDSETPIGALTFVEFNAIHWFLLFSWVVIFFLFLFFFKDVQKPYKGTFPPQLLILSSCYSSKQTLQHTTTSSTIAISRITRFRTTTKRNHTVLNFFKP